jgi:hypothetical protein
MLKPPRVFLLSPAHCGGERMRMLLRDGAKFPLALAVQSRRGAPLGEVFRFASGLYFRGKLVYAQAFGRGARGFSAATVIVPGRGLVSAEERITAADLNAFAQVDVDADNPRFSQPLAEGAQALSRALGPSGQAVLLGSVASGKYTEVLLPILGERLCFPREFVGRGDMSRGGLLLRAVASGTELDYAALAGATLRGVRPPRLQQRYGSTKVAEAVSPRGSSRA